MEGRNPFVVWKKEPGGFREAPGKACLLGFLLFLEEVLVDLLFDLHQIDCLFRLLRFFFERAYLRRNLGKNL